MNLVELENQLEKLSILDNECYSLIKDYVNEGYILKRKYLVWTIYYCEKGKKNYIKCFFSESKACDFFYRLICQQVRR